MLIFNIFDLTQTLMSHIFIQQTETVWLFYLFLFRLFLYLYFYLFWLLFVFDSFYHFFSLFLSLTISVIIEGDNE